MQTVNDGMTTPSSRQLQSPAPAGRGRGLPYGSLLSRIAAAILGGYLLAAASSLLLARLLPLAPAEAVLAATLPSFAIYVGAVLWAFAVTDVGRVWRGLLQPALAMAVVACLLPSVGAP